MVCEDKHENQWLWQEWLSIVCVFGKIDYAFHRGIYFFLNE